MSDSDPKGYYARLGVPSSATQEAIKRAFRRLAKELHPDRNRGSEARVGFQALTEAYETLSDPKARSAYDALRYTTPRSEASKPSKPLEPICCSRCGKVTVQPRETVFTYTVSILVASFRRPIRGIFCSYCARKTAFKATLISAFAGWWGFPLGPIFTIGSIIRNARGGSYSGSANERLLWFNTVAFLSQGKHAISYALAQRARAANNWLIAENATRLLANLKKKGVSAPALENSWATRPLDVIAHCALLVTLPIIIFVLVQFDTAARYFSSTTAPPILLRTASGHSSATPSPPISKPSAPTPPPAAKCVWRMESGDIIDQLSARRSSGHILEIENGSGGNAIIKVRNALTDRLLVSFFVKRNSSASYRGIPDGTFRVQYAIGGDLQVNCKNFIEVKALGQFPEESLSTSFTTTEIDRPRLAYTLDPVADGNVRPQKLDLAAFNAE